MASVAISQRFNAPIHEVFDAVSPHTMLAEVLPLLAIDVVKQGELGDTGVNSVRAMGFGHIKPLKEKITYFEAPHRVEYTVVGLMRKLMKHHHGTLSFTEDGNDGKRTLVVWHIDFEAIPAFMSPVVLKTLKLGIKKGLALKAKEFR